MEPKAQILDLLRKCFWKMFTNSQNNPGTFPEPNISFLFRARLSGLQHYEPMQKNKQKTSSPETEFKLSTFTLSAVTITVVCCFLTFCQRTHCDILCSGRGTECFAWHGVTHREIFLGPREWTKAVFSVLSVGQFRTYLIRGLLLAPLIKARLWENW